MKAKHHNDIMVYDFKRYAEPLEDKTWRNILKHIKKKTCSDTLPRQEWSSKMQYFTTWQILYSMKWYLNMGKPVIKLLRA